MKHVCGSVLLFVVLAAFLFEFREALPSEKLNSQEVATDFEENSIPQQKGALKSVSASLKSLLNSPFALDRGNEKRVKSSRLDSKEDRGKVRTKKPSEKSSKNGNFKTDKVTLSKIEKLSSAPGFDQVESIRGLRDASRDDSKISHTLSGNSRGVENHDRIEVPQVSHSILSDDESLHPENKGRSVPSEDENVLGPNGRSESQANLAPSNKPKQPADHIRIARFNPSTETPENFDWMDGVQASNVDQLPASFIEVMPPSPYSADFPTENVSPEVFGPEKIPNVHSNVLFQDKESRLPTTQCPEYRAIEDDIMYLDQEPTRERDKSVLSDIVSRLKGALQTVEQQVKKSEPHPRFQPLPGQTEMTRAEKEEEEKVTRKFLGFLQQFLGLYQSEDHGLGMRRAIQMAADPTQHVPPTLLAYSKPQTVVENTFAYPDNPKDILKEENKIVPLAFSRQPTGGITIFSYPNKSRDIYKEGRHFQPIVFSKPLTSLFAYPEKGSKVVQIEEEPANSLETPSHPVVDAPIFAYPEKLRDIKVEEVPTSSSVHSNQPTLKAPVVDYPEKLGEIKVEEVPTSSSVHSNQPTLNAPVVAYPEKLRGISTYEKPQGFVVPAASTDIVSQTKLYETEEPPQNHQSVIPRVISVADLGKYFEVVGETRPITKIPEKDQGSIESFAPPKITITHHTGVTNWNVYSNPAAQKLQNQFVISGNNYKTLDSRRPDSAFNPSSVNLQRSETVPAYEIQKFDYAISNEEHSEQPPLETNPWARSTTEYPINSELGLNLDQGDLIHDIGHSRLHQRTKESRPRAKDSRAHQHRHRGEDSVVIATEDQPLCEKDAIVSQPPTPVITTIESTQSQETESALKPSSSSDWSSIAVQHPLTQQIQPSVSSVNSPYSAYMPHPNRYSVNTGNLATHSSIQPQYPYNAARPMPVQQETQFRVVPAATSVSGYENPTANFPSLVPAPVTVQRVNASQFVVKHQEPLIINYQSDPYIMDWYKNASQVRY